MRLRAAILVGFVSLTAGAHSLEYQARLLTPVASYSPKGTRFEARIVGALARDPGSALPPGSTVSGEVVEAHPIRFGVRRERAVLQLRFDSCHLPSGAPVDCTVSLALVDNARETVQPDGRIKGILAASHPHSWLGGVWVNPGAALSHRSAAGLTGTAGRLQNAFAPTPVGAAFAIASRLVLFQLPNAEIELPSGTEVVLRVAAITGVVESSSNHPAFLTAARQSELAVLDSKVEGPGGRSVGDIINLAFAGSRESVEQAFTAAGWVTADALTPKSFARMYTAVAGMKAYPKAPVSNLYYEGRLPDLVFQKAFNSVAKRHHIRLWRSDTIPDLWLGAATHDVAAGFDWGRLSLNHVIDSRIDRERQVILNDLRDAECLKAIGFIERPSVASDGPIITDGALAVAELAPCDIARPQTSGVVARKELVTTRVARRLVLESRQYMVRSNPYYWAYRGVRHTVAATRRHRPTADSPSGSSSVTESTAE